MNFITYFALLVSSFSWLSSDTSIKNTNAPQPAFGCKSYYDTTLGLTVYTGVETVPEYPGGAPAWGRYINRNFNTNDIDATMDCNLRIKLVIDSAGMIRRTVPMRGETEVKEPNALEKEALRIYRKSGKWKPGTCNGNNVTTEFVQALNPCDR